MDYASILLSVVGFICMLLMKEAVAILRELKESVEELNVNVAVVVERVDGHERRIGKLEEK